MSDDIVIRIKTLLEKASQEDLNKVKSDIEQRVNPKIKVDVDSKGLDKYKEKYVQAAGATKKLAEEAKEWTNALGKTVKQIDYFKEGSDKAYKSVTEFTNNYKKQQQELTKINAEQSKYWSQRVKETVSTMTQKPDELVKMAEYYKQLEVSSEKVAVQTHKQSLAQKDLLTQIRSMRGKDSAFISDDNLIRLDRLERGINKLDPAHKNFTRGLNSAKSQLKGINADIGIYKKKVQDASKFTNVFGQSIFEAGKKFVSWLLIGNVIMGVARAVRNGIQSITDIDTALTNLNKVTDETRETLSGFSLEANSIGRELAKTTVEVIDSTTEFARLGYSLQQATQLAKQALLYSNVGDIGVEQASLAIISAVKGFGVEVDSTGRNVQKIVDIYNEVGNNFAISSAGIGEAMRRSSASLYAAGNTMEEAVALITAANSSIQDPNIVGTALKTVSMRLRGVSEDGEDVLEYLPKLEQSFKNVGIQIRKDENTFKSTYEIMSDLASVWENLTDVQRANMSELVAGKRQGNIVMAMMTNYKDMQDSLTTALNSTNSALIENEKYMESIQAKQEIFKNTVMGKWQEALNSNVIKGFVVAMTNLVEVLGNAEVVAGLLTTAFLIWKGTAITSAIKALLTFIVTTNTANASLLAMLVTTQGLTKAMQFLKATMATNPLGLLAVVATTAMVAIYGLTNAVKKHREEQQRQIEVSRNQIQTLKQQQSGLKELTSEYETLKSKENTTIEEKKRLLEIQKELVDKYGVSATGINLEGEAYTNSTEAIKLRTLALEEEIAKERERLELSILSADALNTRDIKTSTTKKDKAETKIEKINKVLPYFEENDPYTAELYKKQLKKLNKDIEDANLIIQEASKDRQKYLEYDAQETIKILESEGKKMSDSGKLVVSEFAKSLALRPEDIETQQQALSDFATKVANSDLDSLIEKYNNFVSAINSGDNSKDNVNGLEKTSASITKLINSWTKGNPVLKESAMNFASLYPPTINAKNAIDAFNKSLKETDFKSITDEIKFLHKALQELSSKDGLSSSSKEKILSEYPKLFAYMDDEIELRKQLQTILEESEEQQINAFLNVKDANGKTRKEMLEIDKAYFNNVIKGNAEFLDVVHKAGIKSVDGFKTIAEAKKEIEVALVKDLSGIWKEYFLAIIAGNKQSEIDLNMDLMHGTSSVKENARKVFNQLNSYNNAIKKLDELINEDVGSKLKTVNLGDIKSSSSGSSSKSDKYISDQYAISISALDVELTKLKHTQSQLSKSSQEYRDTLLREIEISKEKQNLAHNEADRLRGLRDQVKKGTKEYDEYTKTINDLGKTWLDLQSNIDIKTLEIVNSKTDDLNNVATNTKDILSRIKTELQYLIPGTSEYTNKLQEQVNITKEHINALQDLQNHYEITLASESLSIAQKDQYIAKLKEVKQALFNMQMELKSQLASQADEAISIYKSMYEQQKQITLNSIDDQISAEEKRHKAVIDNLTKEIDKYEELIKAKIKSLEKDANQESYAKKLTKAQKETQEIQSKIDILSLDDSYEARAKREDLNKQLTDKTEEIEEMQNKRSLDMRKDNLNDLLDNHKKQVDNKKKTEDKIYNMEKDRLEKIKKETERYWNEQINNERKWMQVKQDIMNGNLNEIKDSFASFTSILNGNLQFLGNSVVNNLIDKMQQAKIAIDSINSQMNSLPSSDTYDIGSNQKGLVKSGMLFTDAAAIAGVNVVYDQATNTIKIGNLDTKFSPTGIGGTSLNSQDRLVIDNVDRVKELLKFAGGNVSQFHDGGIVGGNADSLTQKVNEFFNLKPNETIVKSLLKELQIPQKNISNNFKPNMAMLANSLTPQIAITGSGDGATTYSMNVRIDKVENTDKGVDTFFKRINDGMNKLGK